MSDLPFSGHVVAVTGAAQGLGREISRRFIRAGAAVALLDVNLARLAAEAEALGGSGRARPFGVDVSDQGSVSAAFQAVASELGVVTILVNNAGICGTEGFTELALEEWDRTLRVNLTGAFLCMKAVVPGMIERGEGGRIVNIGSVAGRNGGMKASAAYAASKAGLAGLTRAAAKQLACHQILVNCVAPSTLETEMTAGWTDATKAAIRATVPVGRLGTVGDVAAAVLFLASPEARYLTGVTLDVTGGLFMAP